MAIVSVGKHWDSHEASIDDRGVRTVRETLLVQTDDPIDDPEVILNAADPITGESVPTAGESWSGYVTGILDADLIVRSRSPRQTDDILIWKVLIEYSTEARHGIFDERLQVHEWNGQTSKRSMQRDRNGLALLNSAGQMYDPPLEEEETITIRRITRNEENFNDSIVTEYMSAVNSDTVMIGGVERDPYTVFMKDLRGRRDFAGSLPYHQVTYELHIFPLSADRDQGGWYTRVADAGFQKFKRLDPLNPYSAKVKTEAPDVPGTFLLEHIRDPVGDGRLAQVALLDGDGQELRFAHTKMVTPAGINAAQLSFTVADTAPIVHVEFPFWVQIDSEIMRVDDAGIGAPGTLTVARGQKGTGAAGHAFESTVQLLPIFWAFELKKTKQFTPLGLP